MVLDLLGETIGQPCKSPVGHAERQVLALDLAENVSSELAAWMDENPSKDRPPS